jgi:hypothetical protein
MNESGLKKLKWEAREKELEKKAKAFRREQVERERVQHVKLIGAIYVEPLASHAPITKETRTFEQEQKNRELETTFNFLRRTTTSISTLTPQIIIISKEMKRLKSYLNLLLRSS